MTIHQTDFKGEIQTPPRGVSILKLTSNSCRYPLWPDNLERPGPDIALYCGEQTIQGSSYCSCHQSAAGGRYRRSMQDVVGVAASRVEMGGFVSVASVRARPVCEGLAPRLPATDDKTFDGRTSMRRHYAEVRARLDGMASVVTEPPAATKPSIAAPAPAIPLPPLPPPRPPVAPSPPVLDDEPVGVWWQEMLTVVCRHCGVDVADVMGWSRSAAITRARHVAMYMMYQLTEMSFAHIAKTLCKDPSSVKSAVDKVERMVDASPEFAAQMQAIRLELLGGEL